MATIAEGKMQERLFILELLHVYKSLPALWKVKSKEYTDQTVRAACYEKLLEKYREMFPTASLDDLKKKINILRTNFRKELRRGFEYESAHPGEVYTSKQWFYNALEFLRDQEQQPPHSVVPVHLSFLTPPGYGLKCQEECENDNEDGPWECDDGAAAIATASASTSSSSITITPDLLPAAVVRSKRRMEDSGEQAIKMAHRCSAQEEDDYLTLAKVWASELSKVSPQQQIFAKKFINDVLFEAQMGTLTRHSVRINAPQEELTPAAAVTGTE